MMPSSDGVTNGKTADVTNRRLPEMPVSTSGTPTAMLQLDLQTDNDRLFNFKPCNAPMKC